MGGLAGAGHSLLLGRAGGVGVAIIAGVAAGAAGWGRVSGIRSVEMDDAGDADESHALRVMTSATVMGRSEMRMQPAL
jgi:hypothetical protein